MSSKKRVVVFISGFLTPPNWVSYPSNVPDDVRMISVYPSPTGSVHDRACQVFYELMGGTVDYGAEHSAYHKHDQFGTYYPTGKFPKWSADNPIQIVGHSFGGLTAWVLQNYLADKKFAGYNTSEKWISSVIAVNCPFNGAIRDHEKGLHQTMPPVVRWCSQGYLIGLSVNVLEYIDSSIIKSVIDLDQGPWGLSHKYKHSLLSLMHAFLGVCIHSTTDNISYDASIGSQLAWSSYLRTFKDCYYCSLVGNKKAMHSGSVLDALCYLFGIFKSEKSRAAAAVNDENYCRLNPRHQMSHVIHGVDTSQWMNCGNDLLLSVYTQEYPRLAGSSRRHEHRQILSVDELDTTASPGCWHYMHCNLTHLSVSFQDITAWSTVWGVGRALHKQQSTSSAAVAVRDTKLESLPSSSSGGVARPADCQAVTFSLRDRHSLLYLWSTTSRVTLLVVILLLVLCSYCLLDGLLGRHLISSHPWSRSGGLMLLSFCLVSEAYLLVRHYCSVDQRGANVSHEIDSDAVELLFALLRTATPSTECLVHSGLYLMECLILIVCSHCEAHHYHRRLTEGRGIRDYSLLKTKLLMGLLLDSSLIVMPSCWWSVCLNLMLSVPKLSWLLVGLLWRGSGSSSGTKVRFNTVYCLQMSLWLALLGSIVAGLHCLATAAQSNLVDSGSPVGAVSVVFLIVGGVKWRDMSESFQFVMIKNKYRTCYGK